MKENTRRKTILTLFGITQIDDHTTVIKKLQEGTDINIVDSGGRTLLMESVIRKDHDLTKYLLENGANANIKDRRNWTALHFAAQEYDLFSVKLLIRFEADVNAIDDFGNSVIFRAVMNSRGRGEVLQFLLTQGADVNIKNKSGISALDLARSISNYDVLQFLQ